MVEADIQIHIATLLNHLRSLEPFNVLDELLQQFPPWVVEIDRSHLFGRIALTPNPNFSLSFRHLPHIGSHSAGLLLFR